MAQQEENMYFASEEAKKAYRRKHIITQILLYGFLILVAIFILIPFYWMLNTSLKTVTELDLPQPTLFPREIAWSNYAYVFSQIALFGRYFLNTLLVSVCTTVMVVITTIGAAFAFSRLQFKGRELLFGALLVTMMIPGEMMIITNYMTISVLGWMETYTALIFPFSVSVFYIFFLRQTFKQIPDELYLAAKVDGMGDFGYLFKVMIPIGISSIITIIILALMGAWNAYIWPQLVANAGPHRLITNGLMAMFTEEFKSYDNYKLAASAVVTAPILVFFIIFRKYIMRGVSRSGIKG
ncbi:MAG: carbohydrate ABC transporter permease [Bacilli bacterium]|jgi:multiple sugar transport system permease protein|nr:carbohydrate ABC transporter permease [Bacilli bacterium]MDD3422148.1 carbohydrate ABC transporter permease [Bacilli bacterium]MDD4065464.1 carbohydrate ABC transporter permease [Bacilli bacterium]